MARQRAPHGGRIVEIKNDSGVDYYRHPVAGLIPRSALDPVPNDDPAIVEPGAEVKVDIGIAVALTCRPLYGADRDPAPFVPANVTARRMIGELDEFRTRHRNGTERLKLDGAGRLTLRCMSCGTWILRVNSGTGEVVQVRRGATWSAIEHQRESLRLEYEDVVSCATCGARRVVRADNIPGS